MRRPTTPPRPSLCALVLAAGLAGLTAGCTPVPPPPPPPPPPAARTAMACPTGTAPMLVAELFFGRSIGDGPHPGRVSDADWNRYVADTLSRELPDGFTVRDAIGAWRDPKSGRTVTEATKDVVVALPNRPAALARVRQAMAVYRQRFHQQSVGLLLDRQCGAF
jgi:Protein of unknown function (DUF3574)